VSTRNASGYTLLELLVVITITSMLAIPLGSFIIQGINSYNFIQEQSDTSLDLEALADRITRVVRGATSLDTASPNTLIVYGYFSPQDTVIKKVDYYLSGNNFDIAVTPPTNCDAQGANCQYTTPSQVIVARKDIATAGTPIFTYYADTGSQLTGSFLASQVKEVGIYLAANPNPARLRMPISLSTQVTLRNLKVNL